MMATTDTSVASGGSAPTARGTEFAAAVTGATYRKIDYWIRLGLLGDEHMRGSGTRRCFTDEELEVIAALHRLSCLGCRGPWLEKAAGAMRTRRVAPGEWLIVTLDGDAERYGVVSSSNAGPHWSVPLTAFDQGRPL